MEKKYFLCIFFVALLVSPAPILAEAMEKERETENKRQAQGLLPLAAYAGLTVSAPLFAALVAAYGIYAVTSHAIRRDSHTCASNRGWCRAVCFPHEYIDDWHSDVCGSYNCCRSKW